MTEAEFHQQQLEQQEQNDSVVSKHQGYFEGTFQTHIHSDKSTVWVNIRDANSNYVLTLTKKAARQIAVDLFNQSGA